MTEQHRADMTQIETLFEQRGLRWTVQRQLVLQIIQKHAGHLTAEDIYQELIKTFPSVNLTTIYRTLETLSELGVTVQIDSQGDMRRYEMVRHNPHYHAICENCQAQVEIDKSVIDEVEAEIRQKHNLKLHLGHFVGLTLCEECRLLLN